MLNQTNKKLLLFLPLCVVSLVLLIRIFYIHKSPRSDLSNVTRTSMVAGQKTLHLGTIKDFAVWQNGDFIDINSPELTTLLNRAIEADSRDLSEAQAIGLKNLIIRFFQAYSSGSFEDYFNLKTSGANYSFDFSSERAAHIIKSLTRGSTISLPEDQKAKLNRIWELANSPNTNHLSPHLIQIESNKIQVTIITNKLAGGLITEYALKLLPNLHPGLAPNYFIKYDKTPLAIIMKEGHVLVAVVEFVGRTSSSDTACPMFVTFYWSSEENRWFPWELAKYLPSKLAVLFNIFCIILKKARLLI